jgi:hypothetical protein
VIVKKRLPDPATGFVLVLMFTTNSRRHKLDEFVSLFCHDLDRPADTNQEQISKRQRLSPAFPSRKSREDRISFSWVLCTMVFLRRPQEERDGGTDVSFRK